MSTPTDAPRRSPWPAIVEGAVLTATALVVLLSLGPQWLASPDLPWRSDLSGHAVVVWADQQQPLLALPGSWTDLMLLGFPINQLYPWFATSIGGLLAHLVGLGPALRWLVVLPLVSMPVAAWAAARLNRAPAGLALLLAVATLPFLFDTKCEGCGGNVVSTIGGEYAYAWSLALAVLALGLWTRLLTTGRGVWAAALVTAASAWSHPVPPLWLAVGVVSTGVLTRPWRDKNLLRPALVAVAASVLLALLWWLPFLARRDWMAYLGLSNVDVTPGLLFPGSPLLEVPVAVLLVLGSVWAFQSRSPLLQALVIQTAVVVVVLPLIPSGSQLYNVRLLPFWYLGKWLLVGAGVWAAAVWVSQRRSSALPGWATWALPAVPLALITLAVGYTWGWLGSGSPAAAATGLLSASPYAERVPAILGGPTHSGEAQRVEDLQDLMRTTASESGCGRVLWDLGNVDDATTRALSDPFLLWQAGIWTEGCVTPADGVLLDSSSTAPAVAMTASLVSQTYPRGLGAIPALQYNLAEGLPRMRTLGIRYYVTSDATGTAAAQAAGLERLHTSEPWSVWAVDSDVVSALPTLPVVASVGSGRDWQDLVTAYFPTQGYPDNPLSSSGPVEWPVLTAQGFEPGAAEDAGVSDVDVRADGVSFSVAKTGQPVLVRVSDYPGWEVEGASVVVRATPNVLVVVPDATQVTVQRSRTPIDWAAMVLALFGFGVLIAWSVVARRRSD